MWATAWNRKQNKTREFVVWARICNAKPELNDFRGRYLGNRALLICYRRREPKTYFTGTSLGDNILHSYPENRSARAWYCNPGPKRQTHESCFVFGSVPQRRPSVRRTLGTKKSLALRAEFLGGAWSAPRGLARAPPNGHRCRRRSHEQVIVSARALENPKRFAPDACQ